MSGIVASVTRMNTRPFTIHVPDGVLQDLRDRMARTRFVAESPGRPQSGMTAAYLRELVTSWQELDWRTREKWLPRFRILAG